MMSRLRERSRRSERGATLLEFAIVAPLVFLMLFGIIAGCYLFYQNSALHDGASAAARAASIETSLTGNGGCESASPQSIERAVADAAPSLAINMQPLCSNGSTTTLTQTSVISGDVNITVTCTNTCASPTAVAVSLTYKAQGLAPPLNGTYNMSATSAVQILTP